MLKSWRGGKKDFLADGAGQEAMHWWTSEAENP